MYIARHASCNTQATHARSTSHQLAVQKLEPRVTVIEQRLAGVHNLHGRMLALDQVAAELDLDIPSIGEPSRCSACTHTTMAACSVTTSDCQDEAMLGVLIDSQCWRTAS